jgi:hypothetical protein
MMPIRPELRKSLERQIIGFPSLLHFRRDLALRA